MPVEAPVMTTDRMAQLPLSPANGNPCNGNAGKRRNTSATQHYPVSSPASFGSRADRRGRKAARNVKKQSAHDRRHKPEQCETIKSTRIAAG